eukprot:gene5247-7292_t
MESSSVTFSSSHLLESSKDVISSIVGSAACVYTGQPFDTIKVRLQVQQGTRSTILEIATNIFKNEGVSSFWRGSVPAFLGALSENAVAFGVNGFLKRLSDKYIHSDNGDNSRVVSNWYTPFLNGGITGVFSSFALCPCDVVKCRSQVNTANGALRATFSTVVSSIIRNEGFRGLYRGIGAQLCRDVPFYCSFFGSYDVLCQVLRVSFPEASDTSIYFTAGGFAGQIGWIISIAPDVVKSKIQSSSISPAEGIKQTMMSIYKIRGIKGFFAGIEVAVIRAFPANAALFVGYELSRDLLGKLY